MPSSRFFRGADPGLRLALWLLITLRVGLELAAFASLRLWPAGPASGFWFELVHTGGEPWSELLSLWQRWDALWYEKIVRDWYRPDDFTTHFEPLYPLLGRALALATGAPAVLALLVVASLCYVAAMWLLYRVARLDVGHRPARLAVLLTAFFPAGFFMLAPYSESLFLALTLGAFLAARRGRPWVAGGLGFLAGTTRDVGALLVLPLAYEYLRQRDAAGQRPGPALLAAALPPLGLAAATAYFRAVIGERRSVIEVAGPWGDRLAPPWEALATMWEHVERKADPVGAFSMVALFAFALIAVGVFRRLPLAYSLYVVPYLALMFCRQSEAAPAESIARYLLVLFPCFVMLGLWLARRPALTGAWLAIGLLLQSLLLVRWTHYGFVG